SRAWRPAPAGGRPGGPGGTGRHQPHPREHRADREGAPGARAAPRERDPHGNLLQLPTRPAASLEAVTASTALRYRPRALLLLAGEPPSGRLARGRVTAASRSYLTCSKSDIRSSP